MRGDPPLWWWLLHWPRTAWRARVTMRYGWCPSCNSSPPLGSCPVCRGDREYGPAATATQRRIWVSRWRDLRGC